MWKPKLPPFRKHKQKVFQNAIETGQFIYQIGESDDLRRPSRYVPIHKIKSIEIQDKIQYLKKCLRKYRKLTGMGRGITGVQVGISERLAVIYMSEIKEKFLIILNPKITKFSPTKLLYPEICMSANPIIAPVVRPSWIEFEYYDETGKKQIWNQKDDSKEGKLYNRVFQHEIDHMNGIINIDLVESKTLIFESNPKFYATAKFEEVK